MKFIFLSFFILISKSFALEYNDVINGVSVIKSYDNNYLVLNRGLEDGIKISDHIKLTNENGYIARAICIKASMLLSHWKVYRVVNPELLSFDDRYRVNSMNQSEVPEELAEFKTADFSNEYNDISDEDMKKPVQMQQTRIANFDLPSDVQADTALVEANKSESEKFMDRNFDSKKFSSEMQMANLSLFASQLSWQSRRSQQNIYYGLSLGNGGQKYDYLIKAEKRLSKQANIYTDEEVSSESTHYNFIFNINDISENIGYFMLIDYNQSKIGDVNYPRSQLQTGLLGFNFNIIKGDSTISNLDFAYITLIDNFEYDTTDGSSNNLIIDQESKRLARHGLRLRLNANLSESTLFDSTLWYKPAMNLENQKLDYEDNLTEWTNNLSIFVSKDFSVSYQFKYSNDIRLKRLYNIDPINQISTINLNYSLSL